MAEGLEELCPDTFDLIILNQVLEHIPLPKELLSRLVEYLRAGGGCRITVPYATLQSPILAKGPFQPLEHVNGFTPASLRKIVTDCGLVVRKDYATHTALNATSLLRSIGRNIGARLVPYSKWPVTTSVLAIKPRTPLGD